MHSPGAVDPRPNSSFHFPHFLTQNIQQCAKESGTDVRQAEPVAISMMRALAVVCLFLCCSIDVGQGLVSRRARCALHCYAQCASAGTPKAVYCNCPAANTDVDGAAVAACESVSEHLLTERTVERLIESESGYKNVRTIWLRVEPIPSAFIYVFEFSVLSAERPIWTFAGASSAPQITLSLPDACRDYQFRVLVVLRATNPREQLIVFRPKPIAPQFPAFVVPKESIHMDRPKQSSDGQTLHVSVSWQHPPGYEDGDIYGYSPPTAYPIRCQTPEDRLSQPRLELVQGGARLHLALPVDVLQERCRIYLEVRMLPRCVRIEPYQIQVSVELDCEKFPNLRYCKKEQGAQCTDVVDLWGKADGRAIVVWQRPAGQQTATMPLFYLLNWGPAQSQGTPPFVTRRIVQSQQLRVPGNVTKAELGPTVGVQYGLQVCAFYSEMEEQQERENPFHIVPVIPFTCTPCNAAIGMANGTCVDCSKIEESNAQNVASMKTSPPPLAEPPQPVDCIGPGCSSANRSSVHFISSDTVVLDVFGAKVSVPSTTMTEATTDFPETELPKESQGWLPQEGPLRQRHSKTYLTDLPIALDSEDEQSSSLSPDNTESSLPTTTTMESFSSTIYHAIRRVEAKTTAEVNVEATTDNIETEVTMTTMAAEAVKPQTEDGTVSEEKKQIQKEVGFTSTEQIAKEILSTASEEKLNVEQKSSKTKNSGSTTMLKITRRGDAPETKNNEEGTHQRQTLSTTAQNSIASTFTTIITTTKSLPSSSTTTTLYQKAVPFEAAEETSDCGISAIGIRAMDPQKLMLAGPIFFMLGLLVGLAMFCTAFIRRRRRHNHLANYANYSASLASGPRKFGPPIGHKFPARSVLAARTAAGACYGTGVGTVGFIGTPIGSTLVAGSSASSNASTASSSATTTADSCLGTLGTAASKQQPKRQSSQQQPHHPPQMPPTQFFADNTARFFMAPTAGGHGAAKNVHF